MQTKEKMQNEVKQSHEGESMTETIKDVLERISKTTSSTEKDSELMEYICHRIGFPNARVVSGIAYLEGHGTLESPPADIHTVAKQILKAFLKE